MFDSNVFLEGTCRNYEEDGRTAGYELQTNITYYRGIPLSMLEYVRVEADGAEEPAENILVSLEREDWFTLKEAETVTTYKWEFGEPLYIRIRREGGLPAGIHSVRLTVATRTGYIPVPLEGSCVREGRIG